MEVVVTAVTAKLCSLGAAAFQVESPAWPAWSVHVPVEFAVTDEPVTLHTMGVRDVNSTGRPDVAVASSARVAPTTWSAGATKVIVWSSRQELEPVTGWCVPAGQDSSEVAPSPGT